MPPAVSSRPGASLAERGLVVPVERIVGAEVPVVHVAATPGDPCRTAAEVGLAADLLGWSPELALLDGVRDQAAAHRATELVGSGAGRG